MHRTIATLMSTIAALVAAALIASPLAEAQVKLRYAHVGVANAPQTLYADEVAKLIKERTNGRVEVQVFPNSQLGGVGELVDGVKSGAISMGHHDFASLGKIVSDTAVFNTPFVYRDPGHSLRATDARKLARARQDQPAAGRQGQHAHHRQLLPGHARAHVEGEGAVARRTWPARNIAAYRSSCGRRC